MQMIKPLFIHLGLMVILSACIFPFDPEIGGTSGSLVVNGRITDQEGFHYIEISRADPVNTKSQFSPVTGYNVEIHDDQGNMFPASEDEPGKYACMITQEYLTIGARFRLVFMSTEGKRYESDYDELLPCPPIDNISYELREQFTTDPDSNYQGAQFFVSTNATGGYAKNYLWEMVETWEYHSKYRIQDYWDGQFRSPELWSDNLFYCWDTGIVPEIFVYSTRNLTVENIRNFPLFQTRRINSG